MHVILDSWARCKPQWHAAAGLAGFWLTVRKPATLLLLNHVNEQLLQLAGGHPQMVSFLHADQAISPANQQPLPLIVAITC